MPVTRLLTLPALGLAVLALAACSDADTPATNPAPAHPPGQQMATDAPALSVPAGRYALDRDHSSLHVAVQHLGLSDYVMRFTDYQMQMTLNPDDIGKSQVTLTIDPTSIAADYHSDYQTTHPDAEYGSWTETLARSDKFFDAGQYPEIRFESTSVTRSQPGHLQVQGDLTLKGQTHPVSLDVSVAGTLQEHPMAGVAAVAFAATGSFNRSDFGMDYLLAPPLVGDKVTINFVGEFLKTDTAADTETADAANSP